jgi:hypothetical protein
MTITIIAMIISPTIFTTELLVCVFGIVGIVGDDCINVVGYIDCTIIFIFIQNIIKFLNYFKLSFYYNIVPNFVNFIITDLLN